MKEQKLIYVQIDTSNLVYEGSTNPDSGYDEYQPVPIELPLESFFDEGWHVASYQFRDSEDSSPSVVVLLERDR